jgi:RND family efflux transporter MFP subunit
MARYAGSLGMVSALFLWSGHAMSAPTLKPLDEVVIMPTYQFPAEVISRNDTILSAELSARLDQVLVRPGQVVKQGQKLAELDCRDSRNQLDQLKASEAEIQASLDYAKAQLARWRNLQHKELAASTQVESAESDRKRLTAMLTGVSVKLEQAKRNIERCDINAPFTGVIQEQMIGVGSLASVGTPILRLIQTESAEIKASLPLLLATQLKTAPLRFQAQSIESLQVKLLRQSAVIDSNTRSVTAWFTADIPLRIGLSGQLTLKDQVPHIPAGLQVRRGDEIGFFVREDAKAKFIPLPLAQEGRPTPVPDALRGQKLVVISDGFQRMNDGDELP